MLHRLREVWRPSSSPTVAFVDDHAGDAPGLIGSMLGVPELLTPRPQVMVQANVSLIDPSEKLPAPVALARLVSVERLYNLLERIGSYVHQFLDIKQRPKATVHSFKTRERLTPEQSRALFTTSSQIAEIEEALTHMLDGVQDRAKRFPLVILLWTVMALRRGVRDELLPSERDTPKKTDGLLPLMPLKDAKLLADAGISTVGHAMHYASEVAAALPAPKCQRLWSQLGLTPIPYDDVSKVWHQPMLSNLAEPDVPSTKIHAEIDEALARGREANIFAVLECIHLSVPVHDASRAKQSEDLSADHEDQRRPIESGMRGMSLCFVPHMESNWSPWRERLLGIQRATGSDTCAAVFDATQAADQKMVWTLPIAPKVMHRRDLLVALNRIERFPYQRCRFADVKGFASVDALVRSSNSPLTDRLVEVLEEVVSGKRSRPSAQPLCRRSSKSSRARASSSSGPVCSSAHGRAGVGG